MQCFSQCAKYAVGDANVDCEIVYFLIYTIVNFSFYICMQCVKNVHEDVGLQRVLFFWFVIPLGGTVHDTENLTCSADYRAGNPHIAVQPSAYVCTENYWISCRTISGFHVEFCGYNKQSH